MRLGVVFPQTEIGADPAGVRAYSQAVEGLGFEHLVTYDHVLGADPAGHPGFSGPYTHESLFHEPFVLFGYLAAVAPSLELVTGIIILPQRQTALVAKQAAEVDILTGGRSRLGVGLGWNTVEYEALGMAFGTRARRLEEQVALLRRLWTERSVTFDGDFDRVTSAGLAPPPVQRPIPVWIGAFAPAACRRAGRLADGWFPMAAPGPRLDAAIEAVHEGAIEAGRDPASIGMEAQLQWRGDADELAGWAERWRAIGATHVGVNTMGAGLGGVDGHLRALGAAAEALAPLAVK